MRRARSIVLCLLTCGICMPASGMLLRQQDGTDAVEFYIRAAGAIELEVPEELRGLVCDVPPFNEHWQKVSQESWDRNVLARSLLRQATNAPSANWRNRPMSEWGPACRKLLVLLTETAIYQHMRGDNAGAIATVSDGLTMSRRLRADLKSGDLPRLLLSCAIETATIESFQIIVSDVRLTSSRERARDLHVEQARALISELLEGMPVEQLVEDAQGINNPALRGEPTVTRVGEVLKRTDAARAMSAISLACHLFRFEKGRWPTSLEELVPAYIPVVPLDPWGDGQQSYGYLLLRGVLPDGRDRPMVYARCDAQDGLRYPTRRPVYDYYIGDALGNKSRDMSRAGQFRDIARWSPAPEPSDEPTLKPIP